MKALPSTKILCSDDVETYMEQAWHYVEDELPQPVINDKCETEAVQCIVLVHYTTSAGAGFDLVSIRTFRDGKWDNSHNEQGEIVRWAYAHELVPSEIIKSVYR